MRRLAPLLLLVANLTACIDLTSEDCQEDTEIGVLFVDPSDATTNMPTAVGGTQRFTASTNECAGHVKITNLLAVTEDPTIATVQVVDDAFDVTGVGSGSASLHISGKPAGGAASFTVLPLAQVALSGQVGHATFRAGVRLAEIQLLAPNPSPVGLSPGTRCVDRNVTVTGPLALGDRWDQLVIGDAAPGDYDETIHAGGSDWPITVTITN